MDWKDKIKAGMKLIKEGCAEQDVCSNCYQCPFNDYCTTLVKGDISVPDFWEIEE